MTTRRTCLRISLVGSPYSHILYIMSIYGNFIGVLTAHTLYIPADVSHGTVDTDSDDAEPRSRKKSKISQRENGIILT